MEDKENLNNDINSSMFSSQEDGQSASMFDEPVQDTSEPASMFDSEPQAQEPASMFDEPQAQTTPEAPIGNDEAPIQNQKDTNEDETLSSEAETKKEPIQVIEDDDEEEDDTQDNNPTGVVTVRPVKFKKFEATEPIRTIKKNLDIMQDISMHISVELGRTKLSIKEVMDFEQGSIVELDKIAGEQVEVYVNGKLVAKGEVIVIEDRFGVRITSTNVSNTVVNP